MDPVRVVSAGERYTGVQGLSYFAGVSAESAGSHALCLHALTIPPGGRARAHLHEGHESAIYLISGDAVVWYGEGLAERLEQHPGDFVYIPAGTPHLPVNASDIIQNWPRRPPCVRLSQPGSGLIEMLDRLVADVARSYPGRQAGRILLHRDRRPVRRLPCSARR